MNKRLTVHILVELVRVKGKVVSYLICSKKCIILFHHDVLPAQKNNDIHIDEPRQKRFRADCEWILQK